MEDVYGSDEELDSDDPCLERAFRGHRQGVLCLAFKKTMTQLASGSQDHTVMAWNFKPGMRAFRFVGHKVTKYFHEEYIDIRAVPWFNPAGNHFTLRIVGNSSILRNCHTNDLNFDVCCISLCKYVTTWE
jgi:WD40 repeat protein